MSLTSGNEFTKTLLFVATAVLTMFLAIKTRPQIEMGDPLADDEVGQSLFPDFTDTSQVTGLEVLSFNDELGSLKPFKIEQARAGEWVIPSRQGYPADAQVRVARAATMFVDLKVLRVVDDADHQSCGVVEPKFGVTSLGDEGVGTLFKVVGNTSDQTNVSLAELIIGKPAKDFPGQHYVRRPGKSRVYRVEINPAELSTDFTDWIDPVLLPFTAADIESLTIRSYATNVEDTEDGNKALRISESYEATVRPTAESQWKLSRLLEFQGSGLTESQPETGEILNQKQITELLQALDVLAIANVQRKPTELSEKLLAGNLEITTVESSTSLASRGFYPARSEDGPGQILAAQGELLVNLKSGIQFRILLGGIQADQRMAQTLNRFVTILPQLNEAAIPTPELEDLPAADADLSDNDRKIAVDRITKTNQRKEAEYHEKRAALEKVVNAFRSRYSNWYYLVAEDTARNLRIPRSELITWSQAALEEGFGLEAFRKLQADGLETPDR